MIGLLYIFIGAVLIIFILNLPISWVSQKEREEVYARIERLKKGINEQNNNTGDESRNK